MNNSPELPLEIFDQHVAIIGKTGSGKSYTAKRVVERLLDKHFRVCIVDPTGGWWGLRASADGKRVGYPVAVFGGDHGDLPLNEHHGATIAEAIAKGAFPCIIDLSVLLVGQRQRFMTAFASALYHHNRAPLYLVIDEADEFAPQSVLPEARRMMERIDNIVRRGRSRGFRVTLISQRPAVLHKNVLTQANAMIAMRLTGPQDRKAVREWVKEQADETQAIELMQSLPTLAPGEGWVWAPELGIMERRQFPKIRTFDSSAAPAHGDVGGAQKLAVVNLVELKKTLEAVVAEAEKNDPAKLRARIAELEKQAKPNASAAGFKVKELDRVRQEGYAEGYKVGEDDERNRIYNTLTAAPVAEFIEACEKAKREWLDRIRKHGPHFSPAAIGAPLASGKALVGHRPPAGKKPPQKGLNELMQARVEPKPSPLFDRQDGPQKALGRAERAILTALASFPAGRTKVQTALLAGYAAGGGAFANALGALRSAGLIEGQGSAPLKITPAGKEAIGPVDPVPTGSRLIEYWKGKLGRAERQILDVLVEAYPNGLPKSETAIKSGYEAKGGAFANALGRLRTLELITGRGSEDLQASHDLFQ